MYRGTTPTYTFKTPEDLDLSQMEKVYITFSKKSGREIITKTNDDLVFEDGVVKVRLTQEESLSFPEGIALVQLNWLFRNENDELDRACSNILNIKTYNNLKDEILEL